MMLHIRALNLIKTRVFRIFFRRSFKAFGKNSQILSPIAIEGSQNIEIGDNIYIAAQTCLAAKALTGSGDCTLRIGSGSKIGRFNHIFCTNFIEVGENVLTANGVYISDNNHGYNDIMTPIMDQPITQLPPVTIGNGTWIGQNVAIVGASVGKNCVIAANSVVTRNVPDYCVAAGAPAKVIKRFDPESGIWICID